MSPPRTAAELMRLYYRALDTQDVEAIEDLFTADADWSMPGRRYVGAAAIRAGNAATLAAGVRTHPRFLHPLDGGSVALAEVEGDNRVGGQPVAMHGAVVVEARDGRIARFAVYPDPGEYRVYSAARAAVEEEA